MGDAAAREAVVALCRRLEAEGLVVGTYGNVAVRTRDGLLVTPSRVPFAHLTPDDLVAVGLDGTLAQGQRIPSSETSVHRLVLVARDDVHAIVHTHALHATAASCLGEAIPPIVEEQAQVLGGTIPCTRYVPAGDHRALGDEVSRTIGAANAVLLANHGVLACGRTLDEAYFATVVADRVARMWLLARTARAVVTIPDRHVRSEHERYRDRYGTAADGSAA